MVLLTLAIIFMFIKTVILRVLLSDKCNNNCVFCTDRNNEKLPDPDKFPASFRRLMGKLGKIVGRVEFSGFEPTMSAYLPLLVEMSRDAGIRKIHIQTNGCRLADRGYLVSLIKAGLNSASISIHGSCAGVHDKCTRTPGSFLKAMAGLRSLILIKNTIMPEFEVNTTSVICRQNICDFENFAELLVKMEGLSHSGFNPVIFLGSASRNSSDLIIRYSDILDVWNKVMNKRFAASPRFRDRVGVTCMPACLLPEFDYNSGNEDSVICIAAGSAKFIKKDENYGVKRDKCEKCGFFAKCPGIAKIYLDEYGWGEFNPVNTGLSSG